MLNIWLKSQTVNTSPDWRQTRVTNNSNIFIYFISLRQRKSNKEDRLFVCFCFFLTCFGEAHKVLSDYTLEALVLIRRRLSQDKLQSSKEGYGVQTVEGEAAGELQQTSRNAHRRRRSVFHNVAVHGAAQCSCGRERWESDRVSQRQHQHSCCWDSTTNHRLPAALRVSSLLGQVTLMSDTMVV